MLYPQVQTITKTKAFNLPLILNCKIKLQPQSHKINRKVNASKPKKWTRLCWNKTIQQFSSLIPTHRNSKSSKRQIWRITKSYHRKFCIKHRVCQRLLKKNLSATIEQLMTQERHRKRNHCKWCHQLKNVNHKPLQYHQMLKDLN